MAILTKGGKSAFTSDTYADIATLLSSCNDVISAEVPNLLRDVAIAIQDKEGFRSMSDEEALDWLKRVDNEAGRIFRVILKDHGHRGFKEFDPLVFQWRDNSLPLIKSLKSMVSGDPSAFRQKPETSVQEIIDSLKTQLSPFAKFLLKNLFLPWSRTSVGNREQSKSFIINLTDIYRQAFWRLARKMAYEEGRIPEPDLLFYLKFEEIQRLVTERDPLLVSKAKQRKRAFSVMDRFKFNEITKGPKIEPRVDKPMIRTSQESFSMSGTPVCGGIIEGRAFVAQTVEEAVNIQPGDILITYSTDIGWSPYFPMLSGLATEIGGLVSHGAVIAREYGLPCLVGIEGACNRFKTGDNVLLDSSKGLITKL
jgi:pyruvate,water dikinase